MEKRIYLCDLYDYYKLLFTEKQQEYFEDYYFNNLSLAEIAENNDVSRNAVHNQLKIVETKLEEYETKLELYSKKNKIIEMLSDKVDNEILEELIDLI